MDPNYWASGLRHPSQPILSRTDSMQPGLSSAALGSNAMTGFDLLQLIERQRIAQGFAANFLSHQQNLFNHPAYSGSMSSGAYPGSLLDVSGTPYGYQSYPASMLSQFPGSFAGYESCLQRSLGEGSSLGAGSTSMYQGGAASAQRSVPNAAPRRASDCSAAHSLQQQQHASSIRAAHVRGGADSSNAVYCNESRSHEPSLLNVAGHANNSLRDGDSRYFGLNEFIDTTAVARNRASSNQNYVAATERSGLAPSSADRSGSQARSRAEKPSQNASSARDNAPASQRSNYSSQTAAGSCQKQSNSQFSGAVSQNNFSRVESGASASSRGALTNNASDYAGQYGMGSMGASSGDRHAERGPCESTHKGGQWQYGQSARQYESLSPEPSGHSTALNFIDSLYPSAGQGFVPDFNAFASGYPYSAAQSSTSRSSALDSGGSSVSRKRTSDSEVGIVRPMPQSRDVAQSLKGYDCESFDPLRYPGTSSQHQKNVYSDSDRNRPGLFDAPSKQGGTAASFREGDPASQQPIYLANINGNVYVNQYTMFQPGLGAEMPLLAGCLDDDYHPLAEFGVGHHGYQGYDRGLMGGAASHQFAGGSKGDVCQPAEPKEPAPPARSTMLVPSEADQELGHLITDPVTGIMSEQVGSSGSVDTHGTKPDCTIKLESGSAMKTKPSNAFENSFLKFVCGEKTETLTSVISSEIKSRPALPKYVPEPSRRRRRAAVEECAADANAGLGADGLHNIVLSNLARATSSGAKRKDLSVENPVVCRQPGASQVAAEPVGTPEGEPRMFPAKFSHKMHNRATTVPMVGGTVTRPVGGAVIRQMGERAFELTSVDLGGLEFANSTSLMSMGSTQSSARRTSGEVNESEMSLNGQLQWTVAKKSRMEVTQSTAHIPVLVIKAMPSLDPSDII